MLLGLDISRIYLRGIHFLYINTWNFTHKTVFNVCPGEKKKRLSPSLSQPYRLEIATSNPIDATAKCGQKYKRNMAVLCETVGAQSLYPIIDICELMYIEQQWIARFCKCVKQPYNAAGAAVGFVFLGDSMCCALSFLVARCFITGGARGSLNWQRS